MVHFTRPIAALIVSLLLAEQAFAQADGSSVSGGDPKAAAEALFEEGITLAEAGKLPQACQKFEASETLDAAVGTLLRLADCYERTGRLASAWARFREARSMAQAQAMADRERIATERAQALDAKIARLVVKVPSPPPDGLRVELGETLVPPAGWGTAVPLDAGRVLVQASAPGFLPFRQEVEIPLRDGARVTVEIARLEPELSGPKATRTIQVTSDPSERPRRRLDTRRGSVARGAGIGLSIIGGVGLATGGVLAFVSAKRNDRSLNHCPESATLCTPQGVALRNEAGKLADYATVSAAIGGGLLLTGLVVYVTAPRGAKSDAVALTLSPEATGGFGLRARGAF
jgi:hypothetical protein